MADFEGEEFISDEELAQINAQRHFTSHPIQQHLSNLASMYHTHLPHGKIWLNDLSTFYQDCITMFNNVIQWCTMSFKT